MRWLLLSFLMFAVAAEDVVVRTAEGGVLRPVVLKQEVDAGRAVDAVDAKLAAARLLSAAERRRSEAGMGRTLEKLVVTCNETKHLNKALYLLAAWKLTYSDGDGVDLLLDRLVDTKYPAYQQAAKALRVQWLVGRGKLSEARREADALAAAVPEFAGARDLVAFHEQLGQKAPRTAGLPLSGAPADPATRSERFLLYHFTNTLDDEGRYQLGLFLDELKRADYDGVIRMVCVVSGSNPLTIANALQEIPGANRVDLLWANPGADGEAQAWIEAWKLPSLPATVLLGPDRTIIAIQPAPTELRALVGKPAPTKRPAEPAGPRNNGKTPWGK